MNSAARLSVTGLLVCRTVISGTIRSRGSWLTPAPASCAVRSSNSSASAGSDSGLVGTFMGSISLVRILWFGWAGRRACATPDLFEFESAQRLARRGVGAKARTREQHRLLGGRTCQLDAPVSQLDREPSRYDRVFTPAQPLDRTAREHTRSKLRCVCCYGRRHRIQ